MSVVVKQQLTVTVAGTRYLVHPQILCTIDTDTSRNHVQPVVVFSDFSSNTTVEVILQQIRHFQEMDDVYTPQFGTTIIFLSGESQSKYEELHDKLLNSGHISAIYEAKSKEAHDIPSGPYFLNGNALHQAWRLYPDELDSFIFAMIPDDVKNLENTHYSVLNNLTPDGLCREVAVPSRLYSPYNNAKPLSGARFAIKDIFALSGTKTTMMSRSYSNLYGPSTATASYILNLQHLGAIILGKTKLTSFASSEEPTDQWIDWHCPVNPRGDGYQTAGSVRAPATCNGLYSLRASWGTSSMDGVVRNSPAFDVVGHFSRSLQDLHHIVSTTMDVKDASAKYPSKILYPLDFFPHSNPTHQKMVDEFIYVLEKFLGTKRVEFSLAERWSENPPNEANGKSLEEYLDKSAFYLLCHDYFHEFTSYRTAYRKKFNQEPYTSPVVSYRWSIGETVTEAEYLAHTQKLHIFQAWFSANILSTHSETLSNAIMIMPYGSANPKYRDAANEPPSTSPTVGEKFSSPVLGMPQLVLPFAQMPYESRVSGKREYRPIASTLVGARGSDLMLIKLAQEAFTQAKWRTSINTGKLMFPVAENTRNTADDDGFNGLDYVARRAKLANQG